MKCQYCDQPAAGGAGLSVCEQHTVAAIIVRLAAAWSITSNNEETEKTRYDRPACSIDHEITQESNTPRRSSAAGFRGDA